MAAATATDDPSRPFKLPRPRQLDDLTPDQIIAVVWRIAMEICVLRDRLSTHEQLFAEQSLLSREDIEQFTPSEGEAAARQEARNELIESIINDLS